MRRSILMLSLVGLIVGGLTIPALARGNRNPHDQPRIFVTSQDLTYDSIVTADPLPYNGTDNWQQLEMTDDGLETEFGPGDPGYFGGRWFVDMDGNDEPSEGDHFFLCPLLGPGY